MDWSKFEKGVFLVNVLGIIYDPETKKILIGRRKNDPYIKELTWCFPGGRPAYEEDLEYYLKEQIMVKTGLEVEVKEIVFAKTYPEKREFLSIYYLCEVTGGKENASEKFVEIKWVEPTEVQKYFTTSLHPKLLEYLKTL
ncbi:MAG: NUDIX domain-containing protein [Candidatus Aenigmarchaeota archaeon]|nr:NUDIX domain-containing protein [Candidatus Aenigmarchaeota archaeon]